MAEIFGAVAAGIALSSQLIRIGRSIQKATKRVRHARRDVSDLANETIIFAGLYQTFLRTCADDLEKCTSTKSSIGRLASWAKSTIDNLHKLLDKVQAVGSNHRYRYSISDTFAAHFEWFFSKSSVGALRASLSVARECMSGFSNLVCIKKLDVELEYLRAALKDTRVRQELEGRYGMQIEDKIIMVEQEIQNTHTVHRTNKELMHTAKTNLTLYQQKDEAIDSLPAAGALLEFTESLERCEESFLPRNLSRTRTRKSGSNYTSRSNVGSVQSERRPSTTASTRIPHKPLSRKTNTQSVSPMTSDRNSLRPNHTRSSLSQTSSFVPSSASFVSPTSSNVGKASSGGSTACTNITENVDDHIHMGVKRERRDSQAREYINDPDGNILSPPIALPRCGLHVPGPSIQKGHLQRTESIGRHTITIAPRHLLINSRLLAVRGDMTPEAIFQTLKRNADKLDSLDQILKRGFKEEYKWSGIPGLLLRSGGLSARDNHALDTFSPDD
ncbi:uncharacterized protein K460DRAFT_409648 [Cucurbitaria berberidis CBS 394.84]|uniref:Fungal N-terminal domain-containing protein n=1 Tax=Cucurbitaria berberidis CBS 394.84 TaxID=1168544 RepID=A0A9P4GBA1_9PLEO|nr:uncharacterized protein K460DRAFT_409648 [Cucurbitaria berberidis CBS 394.84]KAF1842231.1 hypothetical protein K460DRAFT_409648 [Cucurbitaria berberidis CBS 394.84]